MKLISDIINELVDSEKSINSPLLKTKVLAHRIGNNELYEWASKELGGYQNDDEEVPSYRVRQGAIVGTFRNGNTQYNHQPLLTSGINKDLRESLKTIYFYQSITALEYLLKEDNEGELAKPFSAEMLSMISHSIRKMGNPYFEVINAASTISSSAVTDILSIIRNSLLDFMLEIDKEFGSITQIEELKDKNNEVNEIMKHTIINATGDGNVINTGENSNLTSEINIQKGDNKSLSSYLESIGIEPSDASDLVAIVEDEDLDSGGNFGKKTNGWISRMLNKSLDGSWNVGINTAGALLADAIKSFYI